ncbi:hypothetical protein Cs7R123_02320 [Catellatospora sp. TT07R-123]|uniref:pyridoxal-phosphate dependent enzyme n=1 Tax=Catellatospora sp. TT07R-123 TaxID=2733863 RepID=UPI001B1C2D59|nr:pyridoxal-phosphate dependent enzyme [Catellatospora sp. TT07R-123]GHJ42890.1 hypothetical protein Cs7R123_02320 [Catellatospora sp. TT07R-123]
MNQPSPAQILDALRNRPLHPALAAAVAAGGDRAPELLTLAARELRSHDGQVRDEAAYAWTRALVAALGGTDDVPYAAHVSLADRDRFLAGHHPQPRTAAVALPIVGDTLLVSARTTVNGHTGGPMLHAGEVVLFGGGVEPGETTTAAALREFGEEAGLPRAADLTDTRFDAWPVLTRWTTESGHRASAHVVAVADGAADGMRPQAQEVAAIGRLALDDVFAAPLAVRPHLRVGLGPGRTPRYVGWFDSPTVTVTDPDGRRWELFGLAGAAVAALRTRYGTAARLRAALVERRQERARWRPTRDAAADLALRAPRVRALMDTMLDVNRPPIVPAGLLGTVFGEPSLLVVDAALPLGGSSKARVVAGLVQAAAEAHTARTGRPVGDLRELFDGVTLLAASTGSHARAVAALAELLATKHNAQVTCEFFVSRDIPDGKLATLVAAGPVIRCADFNDATAAAHRRERELAGRGLRAVFLACDPDEQLNAQFGLSGMDGAAGFATLLLDVCERLRHHWTELGLPGPSVDELRIPTSGGATFAACTALHGHGAATAVRSLSAVYDAAAPCLPAGLAARDAGHAVEVDWPRAINGLAQPQMAPGALPLLAGAAVDLHPVTLAAADLAQLLIALDTGLRPERAGAASAGARLLQQLAADGPGRFTERVTAAVAAHPLRRHATALPTLLDQVTRAALPAGTHPAAPASRAYVVSGAACPQLPGLAADVLAANPSPETARCAEAAERARGER